MARRDEVVVGQGREPRSCGVGEGGGEHVRNLNSY